MIALLVALSFVAPATHAHRHAHKSGPVSVHRCRIDARRVEALELRIGSAADREAALERLEDQLESAIERAQQDCGS